MRGDANLLAKYGHKVKLADSSFMGQIFNAEASCLIHLHVLHYTSQPLIADPSRPILLSGEKIVRPAAP